MAKLGGKIELDLFGPKLRTTPSQSACPWAGSMAGWARLASGWDPCHTRERREPKRNRKVVSSQKLRFWTPTRPHAADEGHRPLRPARAACCTCQGGLLQCLAPNLGRAPRGPGRGLPRSFLLPAEEQGPGYGGLRTLTLERNTQAFPHPLPDWLWEKCRSPCPRASPRYPAASPSCSPQRIGARGPGLRQRMKERRPNPMVFVGMNHPEDSFFPFWSEAHRDTSQKIWQLEEKERSVISPPQHNHG